MIEVLLMAMMAPEPAAVVPADAAKPAEVADNSTNDGEKEICRRKFDTANSDGHMLKSRKICKTAAEWAAASQRR